MLFDRNWKEEYLIHSYLSCKTKTTGMKRERNQAHPDITFCVIKPLTLNVGLTITVSSKTKLISVFRTMVSLVTLEYLELISLRSQSRVLQADDVKRPHPGTSSPPLEMCHVWSARKGTLCPQHQTFWFSCF